MEKIQVSILATLLALLPAHAQRFEKVPFGDFEQWTRREIRESGILGGNIRTVYVIGPEETIEGNIPYDYSRTIWASSNAYARVAGITKASVTVEPAKGPDGLPGRSCTPGLPEPGQGRGSDPGHPVQDPGSQVGNPGTGAFVHGFRLPAGPRHRAGLRIGAVQ